MVHILKTLSKTLQLQQKLGTLRTNQEKDYGGFCGRSDTLIEVPHR